MNQDILSLFSNNDSMCLLNSIII